MRAHCVRQFVQRNANPPHEDTTMPAPKRAITDTVVHREPFHDVSEALFMENFSAHGKKPEDSLLASCYDIRTNAVQQCMDLVNSVRRIYANPTLNSVQQDIEVGKLLTPRVTERVNGFNALRQRVLERRGEVTQEIDVKLRPATSYEATIATEIRGYLRSLPDKERFGAITDALKADHAIPLYKAVASAPAFLSGLHPARQAQLRQECLGLVAPEYVGLEAGLDAEATRLQRAAEGVARIFNQRFDFGRADQLAKLAQG